MSNKNFWFKIILLIIVVDICVWASSCSGSRHLTKSSSKSDSTVVIKTESTKDSTVNTSTLTKTETEINNDIQSEDNYTEKTTETTKFDKETGKPIETIKTKEKTGIKKEKDLTKTKQNTDVKDTTATHYKEAKKEDNSFSKSEEASNKKADTNFKLSFGNIALGLGVVIGLVFVAYLIYRKFKRKVKEVI